MRVDGLRLDSINITQQQQHGDDYRSKDVKLQWKINIEYLIVLDYT